MLTPAAPTMSPDAAQMATVLERLATMSRDMAAYHAAVETAHASAIHHIEAGRQEVRDFHRAVERRYPLPGES
jgi:hypothetical protein